MADPMKELLSKRKNRTLATIMNVKEKECDQHLPPEAQAVLRKVIMDTVNDFYDVCLDVIRSVEEADESTVVNWDYIERKLDMIYSELVYEDGSS